MKLLLAGILSVCVFGCSDNDKNKDRELMISLNQSIEKSTEIISADSRFVYDQLMSRLTDLDYKERAELWQPKAILLKEQADNFVAYIEDLKEQLKKEAGYKAINAGDSKLDDLKPIEIIFYKRDKEKELKMKVREFKSFILAIYEEVNHKYENYINTINGFEDSINNKTGYWNKLFKDKSVITALAILNKYENDIRAIENKAVMFFYYKTGYLRCMNIEKYNFIALQESNIVKPGDKMKIYAGIGVFKWEAMPELIVGRKKITPDEMGIMTYEFKTPSQSGKYTVPLTVNFTRSNGIRDTITHLISYTVFDTTKNQQ